MFNVQCSMLSVQCLKTNDMLKTHVVYTIPSLLVLLVTTHQRLRENV